MTKRGAYDILNVPREGLALLHKKAVSHFLAKGGDANGKRAMGESLSLRGVLHHNPCGYDLHIPKSVLAARLAPNG